MSISMQIQSETLTSLADNETLIFENIIQLSGFIDL